MNKIDALNSYMAEMVDIMQEMAVKMQLTQRQKLALILQLLHLLGLPQVLAEAMRFFIFVEMQ
jgi:hypothetical protein